MALQAITLYALHGEKNLRVLADGSVPIDEQRRQFKVLQQHREHPEFGRIELWTSAGGCVKSHRFREPAPEPEYDTNGAAGTDPATPSTSADAESPAAPPRPGRPPRRPVRG